MKIAIPIAQGMLAMHFGHCEQFALVDVDDERRTVLGVETADAPPHEPGALPTWLTERGADVIIAGGMGRRAQNLFARHGIEVVVGAPADAPERLAAAWLDGSLQVGDNICGH
jgi:predicted Fe-Mo cluster-binding NifX family protein